MIRPPVPKPQKAEPRPRGWNSTLPRPSQPIARHTRIRDRNPERLKKLEAEQYGPHAVLVRRMPCVACMAAGTQQMTRTVAAHIKTKGGGGKTEHLAPLCVDHEIEWHDGGRDTFDAKYRVRLRRVALRIWRASPHNPEAVALRQREREQRS